LAKDGRLIAPGAEMTESEFALALWPEGSWSSPRFPADRRTISVWIQSQRGLTLASSPPSTL